MRSTTFLFLKHPPTLSTREKEAERQFIEQQTEQYLNQGHAITYCKPGWSRVAFEPAQPIRGKKKPRFEQRVR